MRRKADGEPEVECPKCQGRLFERALGDTGVKVDVCPSCRGMWFGGGELQEHLDALQGELVPPADTKISPRRCPVCGVNMSVFKYSDTEVEIDLCENCRGVWLDVGELKRLAGQAERGDAKPQGGLLGLLTTAFHDLANW